MFSGTINIFLIRAVPEIVLRGGSATKMFTTPFPWTCTIFIRPPTWTITTKLPPHPRTMNFVSTPPPWTKNKILKGAPTWTKVYEWRLKAMFTQYQSQNSKIILPWVYILTRFYRILNINTFIVNEIV